MDNPWITPSVYAPNREAAAHRLAAGRTKREKKIAEHLLAAQLLDEAAHDDTPSDPDRIAVQSTRRKARAAFEAYDRFLLGVDEHAYIGR